MVDTPLLLDACALPTYKKEPPIKLDLFAALCALSLGLRECSTRREAGADAGERRNARGRGSQLREKEQGKQSEEARQKGKKGEEEEEEEEENKAREGAQEQDAQKGKAEDKGE